MKRLLMGSLVAVALVCFVVPSAISQEPGKKPGEQPGANAGAEAEMMAAWMALAMPGEHHKHLQPMAGHFNHEVKWRMAEEAPWTASAGTTDRKWIMGNRFLQETVKGNMEGMVFEGLGLLGYDNGQKCYVSMWVDSMSTGMMVSKGQSDASGKVFTFFGNMYDPMVQKHKTIKSVIRIINNGKHILEMFDTDDEGKEFKSMTITYTRG